MPVVSASTAGASAPAKRERPLPESASVLLDVVRFTAAVLVLIAHATHPEFGTGWKDREVIGDIAVPIFFVLSGFVIRFVTQTRETAAKEYFIDRASRIYSVVLPAMVFTLLVSAACYALDRGSFVGNGWSATCDHPITRIVLNLTFLSQAWGHNTSPFVDSPFWSLGYECIYYAIFGVAIFASGWRRAIGLFLIACIVGPQVLFLLPVWWLGCVGFDVYRAMRDTRFSLILPAVFAVYLLLASVLAALGWRGLLHAPLALFWGIANLTNPILLLHMAPRRATMFAVAVGLYAAVLLPVLLLVADRIEIAPARVWPRRLRHIAEGTFAIYLLHYPFLVLCLFLGLFRPAHDLTNMLIVALVGVVLTASGAPMDALKRLLRSRLRTAFPG